jgi:integrase
MSQMTAAQFPSPIILKIRSLPDGAFPISELIDRYRLSRPDLKDGTIEQYANALNLVSEWEYSPQVLDEIFEIEQFERFTAWLLATPFRGRRRTLRTVAGRRDTLLTLWKFAFRKRLCRYPVPDRDELARLKSAKEDPVAWSPEAVRKIIASAFKAPPIDWWTPSHWIGLVSTLWYTAERLQGLLSCRREDLMGDVLTVRGSTTKDKKAGVHRLPSWLAELIGGLPLLSQNAPEDRRGLLFALPRTVKTMRNRYRSDVVEPAGLPATGKHLFHCIRRSAITELVNLTDLAEAQAWARHSSPALTMGAYVCQSLLRRKGSSDMLPSPLPQAEQRKLF